MANRASGGADRATGADPFPWVVSLGCLVVGLALFLHSTMPALAEQRELEDVERQLAEEAARTEREVQESRRLLRGVGTDPELLLVQFDERGLTPQQAIDLAAPDEDPAADPAEAGAERPSGSDR